MTSLEHLVKERVRQGQEFASLVATLHANQDKTEVQSLLASFDVSFQETESVQEYPDSDYGTSRWTVKHWLIKIHDRGQLVYDFDGSSAYWSSQCGEVLVFRPKTGSWFQLFQRVYTIVTHLLAEEERERKDKEEKAQSQTTAKEEQELRERYDL
ncbi:MAG: hypothetical protein KDB07_08425 [Planctomycetes bacterium]|nr:hypothetical protein [Planctomycetota bacterium]